MPANSLAANLLVTGIISQLASYPQPLLRSALLYTPRPEAASLGDAKQVQKQQLKASSPTAVGKCLLSSIASLRQRLDCIVPTLSSGEEAIGVARDFLADRVAAVAKGCDPTSSFQNTRDNQTPRSLRASGRPSSMATNQGPDSTGLSMVSSTINHIGEKSRTGHQAVGP